jgi:SAM-dependent methyltransferase
MVTQHKRPLNASVRKALSELGRGAALARHGGPRAGWDFLREEVLRNSYLRLAPTPARAADGVECNVCGWRGRGFLTHCGGGYLNRDAFCPRCMCYPRHRGFAWLLKGALASELREPGSGQGARLLFAPEPGMRGLLAPHVARLEGIDIQRRNDLVVHLQDVQALSFADGSVDFFSCFHVLEHVPDTRGALRELARVLHPRGVALLNVPQTFGRRETIAFGRAEPLANGHWFDFGEDYVEFLVAAGFRGVAHRLRTEMGPETYARLRMQDETIYCLRKAAGSEPAEIVDHAGRTLARRA